jgi:hypothetical protein
MRFVFAGFYLIFNNLISYILELVAIFSDHSSNERF